MTSPSVPSCLTASVPPNLARAILRAAANWVGELAGVKITVADYLAGANEQGLDILCAIIRGRLLLHGWPRPQVEQLDTEIILHVLTTQHLVNFPSRRMETKEMAATDGARMHTDGIGGNRCLSVAKTSGEAA